ncbi:hypothetical protein GJ744_008720 [Endocarpon pusillum]|uniref:Clr5 domain-containing protein n=1 Tax=Endocarpon pusillum TaxID=364733 RepID=A0A8H7E5E4_9EURO|nr:hypothetical protein GJ744_008720 [Endocarpon pusillum]
MATGVDRLPNSDEWDRLRPIFTHYYKDFKNGQGLPLRKVMRIMADKYGFVATERMYKIRVKAWKLQKNYSKKDRQSIIQFIENGSPNPATHELPKINGEPVKMIRIQRYLNGSKLHSRQRIPRKGNMILEHLDSNSSNNAGDSLSDRDDEGGEKENNPPDYALARILAAPDHLKYLHDILVHIDRYYLSCFHGQYRLFSHQALDLVGESVVDTDDGFSDQGLLEIHDPGYAAISLAKSHQYREARIILGEAQDKIKYLLRAQHPTLLPFILEIICEDSTTPEFNVSEWFRRYVCDLCAIIMGQQHSLTRILQLLGMVEYKLETCAMILSKIQAILSAEFGASQWEARRPVKVFCRVLRHLGRYDEIEQILSTAMGLGGGLEKPTQSELLGLLYELAWLSARGRHDNNAATQLFGEILRLTGRDAQTGQISHFRIKALRGLGVLAREEARHEVSEQYFSAAWGESRSSFGRRDSNTVRIGSELEASLRELGRYKEADQLKQERDELFITEDEEAVVI